MSEGCRIVPNATGGRLQFQRGDDELVACTEMIWGEGPLAAAARELILAANGGVAPCMQGRPCPLLPDEPESLSPPMLLVVPDLSA